LASYGLLSIPSTKFLLLLLSARQGIAGQTSTRIITSGVDIDDAEPVENQVHIEELSYAFNGAPV
jgi:hypothetical protein